MARRTTDTVGRAAALHGPGSRPLWLSRRAAVAYRGGMDHTCLLPVPAGRIVRLQRAAGLWLEVRCGRLWLTEAGDPCDRILAAGERHRIAGRGLVLLEAWPDGGDGDDVEASCVLHRRGRWSLARAWSLPAVPARPLRDWRPAAAGVQRAALTTA